MPSSLQSLSFGLLFNHVQPKPGGSELAIESSKLEVWQQIQPMPGAGVLAIVSSNLEFRRDFQPKHGGRDLAIKSSKLEFWQQFPPKSVSLPSSRQNLSFGLDFSQSLEHVTLPSSLEVFIVDQRWIFHQSGSLLVLQAVRSLPVTFPKNFEQKPGQKRLAIRGTCEATSGAWGDPTH